ncbi:MAG: leucine-rich repeat domain-containing protein [archaeon]|jgi:hypothetical protein|nr:leucine-rich repeat domain-containing protein [archaeon]
MKYFVPVALIITAIILSGCIDIPQIDPELRQINQEIENANYCSVDDDCTMLSAGCPFECLPNYVNKNEVGYLETLVANYQSTHIQCEYMCIIPTPVMPMCNEGKCVEKICEINKDYDKLIIEENGAEYYLNPCRCPENSKQTFTESKKIGVITFKCVPKSNESFIPSDETACSNSEYYTSWSYHSIPIRGEQWSQDMLELYYESSIKLYANLAKDGGSALNGISDLTCLTYLSLADSDAKQVSSISALKNLTKLEYLDLRYTQVSNISALSGMTKLKVLKLADTKISNISALSGLNDLEYLDLGGVMVSDISPLRGKRLKELYLSYAIGETVYPFCDCTEAIQMFPGAEVRCLSSGWEGAPDCIELKT